MPQPRVVLAAVGIELPRALLESLQGHQHRLERQRPVVEHLVAEGLAKPRRIARAPHLGQYFVDAAVRHLEGREQGQARLLVRRLRPAVPGPASGGTLIDAVILIVVEIMLGEGRNVLGIHQRRRRTHAILPAIAAPSLHRQIILRPEGVPRVMTGRARHFAGGRQGRIEEQRAADRRHGRGRGGFLEAIRIKRRAVGGRNAAGTDCRAPGPHHPDGRSAEAKNSPAPALMSPVAFGQECHTANITPRPLSPGTSAP